MTLIILLGAPGSGKGSVSQQLVQEHGFIHLSTGRIFRKMKENRDQANSGTLISDDYVNEIVLGTLRELNPNDKVIFDGYPRTKVQAEFLSKHYPIKAVFLLTNINDECIIARLSSRMLCEKEDHSFNTIYNPPKHEGICDFDGSKLYRRPDDQPETIKKRLDIYRKHTQPLIDYYMKNNVVIEIDANQNMFDMTKSLIDQLKNLNN